MIFFLGIFLRDLVQPWFPFLRDTNLLLEWALTSSALILVVIALRAILKERLSCTVRYALWAVVLFRLLVPVQLPLPSPWSAAELTPEPPQSWTEPTIPVFPTAPQDFDNIHPYGQNIEPGWLGPTWQSDFYIQRSEDGATFTQYADIFTPNQVLQSVWLVGVLIFTAAFLLSNLRFILKLDRRRRPLALDGVSRPVYVAEGLPSPCLFGLFRPAIYLTPETAEDETTRRHVLAHELTHYAHRDHIWSALRCLCLALHWYNPLVWLAVILSKRDGELACDEGAVKRLGEGERLNYGRTLLNMVARRTASPMDLLSCSTAMTEGKKTIQQRIQLLVKKPETAKTALFIAVAATALAVMFTFSSAQADYYAQFSAQVEAAQQISVYPPAYFSVFYPDPITDSDLLEEAKALLAQAGEILSTPEELEAEIDFSDAAYTSYRPDLGQGTAYYLFSAGGKCYVLLPKDPDSTLPEQWSYVAVLSSDPGSTLLSLAQRQYNRNLEQGNASNSNFSSSDSPVQGSDSSVSLQASLDAAAAISFHEGFLSSYLGPSITDPTLLSRAKELLGSGDPSSDTVRAGSLYSGSTVTLHFASSSALSFPISNQDMCSELSHLTHLQDEYDQLAQTLTSHTYAQLMAQLPPLLLSAPEWVEAFERQSVDQDQWNSWLFQQLEQLGFDPYYNQDQDLWFVGERGTSDRISLEGNYLSILHLLNDSESPSRISFSCPSQDPAAVAQAFGTAYAQHLLSLDPRHPHAVTAAQCDLSGITIVDQMDGAFVASIPFLITPAHPDSRLLWSGNYAPVSGTSSARFSLLYRLIQREDGTWQCVDWADTGLFASGIAQGY